MKILNKDRFIEGLTRRLGKVPIKNAQRACFKSANLVRNTAVQSILTGPKSGPTVTRYNPKRSIKISAAGQAPASDTGFLANNITSEVVVAGKGVTGIVRASAPYAAHLEFGTSKMPARPFLQPALEKNKKKIIEIFLKEGMIK